MTLERLRRVAGFILGMLLLWSVATAGLNGWALLTNPLATVVVDRATDEIRARLDAALASMATPERMAGHLRDLLVAPRDWSRIDAVLEMAEAREIELPADLVTAIEQAHAEDYALSEITTACGRCLWDFDTCSLANVFLCRVPFELSPVGDVTSITREGVHIARGEEVDKIDLVLSTIGLGSIVIAPLVGGSSLSLKMGASLTKTAYRMGSLTAGVVGAGTRAANRAIDWTLLKQSRPGRFLDDLRKAVRPAEMRPITEFVGSVDAMRASIGARWTLFVRRKVDDPNDIKKVAAISKAGGRETAGALEMLGMKRLLRLAVRWSDEVHAVIRGVASAILAVILFPLALGKGFALRRLRRWARDAGKQRRRWRRLWRRKSPAATTAAVPERGDDANRVASPDAGGDDTADSPRGSANSLAEDR